MQRRQSSISLTAGKCADGARASSAAKFARTAITIRCTAANSSWPKTTGITSRAPIPARVCSGYSSTTTSKSRSRAKNFSGSLIVLDKADKELATLPLAASRDGNTLEARIPPQLATLPLRAKATIKYRPESTRAAIRLCFQRTIKRPWASEAGAATTTGAAAPARPAASTAKPAPAGTAAQYACATTGRAERRHHRADSQEPLILDSPTNIPPALADALDESKLPNSTPELLAELAKRASDVEALVNEGNLSQVWLPATATKTVALVLEARQRRCPNVSGSPCPIR